MAINVINVGGVAVCLDAEAVMTAYGGHALRVDGAGNMDVWLALPEGGEWKSLDEAPLVQPAGKPSKARKQ